MKELFAILKDCFRQRDPVSAINYFAKWA